MRADVPLQEFENAQKTASATLDAVYFEVVHIPEPGSSVLLVLATGVLVRMRRR